MLHLRLGQQVDQCACPALRRTGAGRREIHVVLGAGLAQLDQVGHRLDLVRGRDAQHVRHAQQQRDRRERGERVELHLGMQRGMLRVVRGVQHQRVAVGLRLGDLVRADVAGGARAVLDDHRLAQRARQYLRQHAADHGGYGSAAWAPELKQTPAMAAARMALA
ncbi:hypothetical protein G6F59_016140 [Rhizopus arrhizus]|nr:hypothetical protein G6F59_016140 [Rhizopus arrhizus]